MRHFKLSHQIAFGVSRQKETPYIAHFGLSEFGIGVPFTARSIRTVISPFGYAVTPVVSTGSTEQVGRTEARWVIAFMKDAKTIFQRPVRYFKSQAVSLSQYAVMPHGPISKGFSAARPFQAGERTPILYGIIVNTVQGLLQQVITAGFVKSTGVVARLGAVLYRLAVKRSSTPGAYAMMFISHFASFTGDLVTALAVFAHRGAFSILPQGEN